MKPCPYCNGTGLDTTSHAVLVNTSGSSPEAIRAALASIDPNGKPRPSVVYIGEADSPSFMADLRRVLDAEERYEVPMPKLDLRELANAFPITPAPMREPGPNRKQRRAKGATRGKG